MAFGIVGPLDLLSHKGDSSRSGNSWLPFLQSTMFGTLPHHFTRFPGLKKGGKREKNKPETLAKGES